MEIVFLLVGLVFVAFGLLVLFSEAQARRISITALPCGALTRCFQITVGLAIQSLLLPNLTPEK